MAEVNPTETAGFRLTRDELKQLITEAVRAGVAAALAERGPAKPDEAATLDQAGLAELWGVTTRSIRNWMDTKGLPFFRMGRTVRFRRVEVQWWATKHRPATEQGPQPSAEPLAWAKRGRGVQAARRPAAMPRPGPPGGNHLTPIGRSGRVSPELSGETAQERR